MSDASLIFVYHTDSNPVSLIAEFIREIRPGETHECSLCHLTYNKVRKNPEWVRFIKGLPLKSRFLLHDRFVRAHPEFADQTFPAVFLEHADRHVSDFIKAADIDACQTVTQLIEVVEARLVDERLMPAPPPAS